MGLLKIEKTFRFSKRKNGHMTPNRYYEHFRKFAVVVAWLYFLFTAFMLLDPAPPTDFIPPESFSILHFLAFFPLGALVGAARRRWSSARWFVVLAFWGISTELIQPYVGRSYETIDLVEDLVGAAAGLACVALMKRHFVAPSGLARDGAAAILFRPPFALHSDEPLDLARRQVLVIRRAPNVACPGTLCFPGGGIEKGERPEDAAKREFFEEVGIAIRVGAKIAELKTPSGAILHLFVADLEGESAGDPEIKLRPSEASDSAWRTLPELLDDPDFLPNNLEVVRKLVEGELAIPR